MRLRPRRRWLRCVKPWLPKRERRRIYFKGIGARYRSRSDRGRLISGEVAVPVSHMRCPTCKQMLSPLTRQEQIVIVGLANGKTVKTISGGHPPRFLGPPERLT